MSHFLVNTLLVTCSLLVISSTSRANEHYVRCSASTPTSTQNISVNIVDCSLLYHMPLDIMSDALFIYPSLNIGQMITDNDKGTFFGAGVGAEVRSAYDVSFFIEGGVHWQDDYQFGEKGQVKDYGGPWQFVARLGSSYAVTLWQLGYAYLHVSNGDRFNVNPSFDGHSLFARYQF